MKIIETYIVNWKESQFGEDVFQLCKVHVGKNLSSKVIGEFIYVREYETGKGTKLQTVSREEFFRQLNNPL